MGVSEASRSKVFISVHYKDIKNSDKSEEFSVGLLDDNIYTWEVVVFGPKDTDYENGIFRAEMIFPLDFPEAPPTFRFITPMWHPNIDKEGNVCISILHKPGDDEFGYEKQIERWLPVRSPESIIISIISLLSSPNCESPANLEAAQQYREDPEGYRKKVRRLAQRSLDI